MPSIIFLPFPARRNPDKSVACPKSLSVVEMMKLGKAILKNSRTLISLSSFDMAKMEWVPLQKPVSFLIEEEEFASHGFRKAYKAKSDSPGFECSTWVVKRYLPSAL